MPNLNERELLLNDLDQSMKMAAYEEIIRGEDEDSELDEPLFPAVEGLFESDDEDDASWEILCKLHVMICEKRYMKPRQTLGKSRDYVLNYFLNQIDQAFRKITRVNHDTFFHIVSLIEFDSVFHNVSTCEQAPVHWQLACALDHLGNDGQGVSHARSKLIWGIRQGTVHLYTHRVLQALWRLRNHYIQWPTAAERLQISKRMEAKGFKHLVGFVDGTTIPLHQKPALYGHIFMDRKKRYLVNAQAVCDDQRKIIHFMTGHPGSMGDSRVFSKSIIAQRPVLAFSDEEYLLVDSGYGATTTLVSAYKDNQRDCQGDGDEPRSTEIFNTLLAKARVCNKHTIGILKARWSSMRGMRVDVHERDDMENVIYQATACVVLHNICLANDPWEDDLSSESDEEDEQGPDQIRLSRYMTPGQRKRWQVRRACMAYHGLP